ncbi:MAG TPA: PLP-dependent aminotransferase family protein, partial [Bryobacteraceae bacterium]|nr:PLP-dependent aminotransferase family protein [Bryobacteraceae bacterium]
EESGLLEGQVGRGSFIAQRTESPHSPEMDWDALLPPLEFPDGAARKSAYKVDISFASSRPNADAFPLAAFRRLSKEVIESAEASQILQLGSPHGYPPLRRYLLEQALAAGVARPGDDLIVTNGCQQGLDLLARVFLGGADPDRRTVILEDPVYPGLVRVFSRAGANILSVPVDAAGLDLHVLEETLRQTKPLLLAVTPSFQNPTGATLPLERRKRLLELTRRFGVVLVESDIYSELRYEGTALPPLKQLDTSGNTILLGSYSKISFPGLRVGWVIAQRPVIARLAEAKQLSDLHSDQLSQAVLLRFAQSGELARHLERARATGAERLDAALRACARYLPAGATFSSPAGGMNLWIELPAPLTAESLLGRVEEYGVNFLPGRYFSARRPHVRGLRISFGGLASEQITRGIQILGQTAASELAAHSANISLEPVAALV